jgi:hypothetical protein
MIDCIIEIRRSSFQRSQKMQTLQDLPLLSDTPMQKREVIKNAL